MRISDWSSDVCSSDLSGCSDALGRYGTLVCATALLQRNAMTDPIPAATVIIVRDQPNGYEVLMVEWHAQLAFAGGAAVFPGGRIDEDDHLIAASAPISEASAGLERSEEHTSELQSLLRKSYA